MKKYIGPGSGTTAEYTYNPFGNRISKTVNEDTEYYIYSGVDVIADYDDSLNLKTKYVMNPDSIDEPIIQKKNNSA